MKLFYIFCILNCNIYIVLKYLEKLFAYVKVSDLVRWFGPRPKFSVTSYFTY